MSDYMAMKADQQIEAGLNERDELIARIAELEAEVESLQVNSVHTCHSKCQRIACVQRLKDEWDKERQLHATNVSILEKKDLALLEATEKLRVAKEAFKRIHYNNYRGIDQSVELRNIAGEALTELRKWKDGLK